MGTSIWAAPEVRGARPKYDERCDSFSFGVFMMELVDLKRVHNQFTRDPSLQHNFVQPDLAWLDGSWAHPFVRKTWLRDPARRATFATLSPQLDALAGLEPTATIQDADFAALREKLHPFTRIVHISLPSKVASVPERTGSYRQPPKLAPARVPKRKLRPGLKEVTLPLPWR